MTKLKTCNKTPPHHSHAKTKRNKRMDKEVSPRLSTLPVAGTEITRTLRQPRTVTSRRCVVEKAIRKCLVQNILKEQKKIFRKIGYSGNLSFDVVKKLVERFKIITPSLTVTSLRRSVNREKAKAAKKKKEWHENCTNVHDNYKNTYNNNKNTRTVTPISNKSKGPLFIFPPSMLESSLAAKSSSLPNNNGSIVQGNSGTDRYHRLDDRDKKGGNDDDDDTATASSSVSSMSSLASPVANRYPLVAYYERLNAKMIKTPTTTSISVGRESECDTSIPDDMEEKKRAARYDITIKVIEIKKKDPNTIITEQEFSDIVLHVVDKHNLPALTFFEKDVIFTTIKDHDEFMSEYEREEKVIPICW